MIIAKHSVVTVNYKLQRDNENGELIEETFGSQPLVFLYGVGGMIPAFETNLEGKQAGDSLAFGIKSEDAYGTHDPTSVVSVPKSIFIVEGKLAEDLLVPGKVIPLQDNQGRPLQGKVVEVKGEEVVLDFNHPMADVDLYFTVQVESVRAATESEIAHGHVHGPGGHNH